MAGPTTTRRASARREACSDFRYGGSRPIPQGMTRTAPFFVLLALALLLTASGCGDDGGGSPDRRLGTAGLSRSLERARDAGRLSMRMVATTTRPGRGTRPQFSADGEVDLGASAGEATLKLEGFGLGDMSVSWTATKTKVSGRTVSRAVGRTDGGQLGMLPDEVQALAEVVADAETVRETANGAWTFSVAAATAVRRGIPPQPGAGATWNGEAQANADGRLRRVILRLPTPALGATMPAGTAAIELTLG